MIDISKQEKLKEFFSSEQYMPMTEKQIKGILNINKNDEEMLSECLSDLEKKGYIFLDDSKRYLVTSKSKLVLCKYEAKSKGFGFALYVDENYDKIGQLDDIYIQANNTSSAINGDIVLVKVIKEKRSGNRQEGKIVKIVKRASEDIVGTVELNKNFAFVKPIDKRNNCDIYISKKNIMKAKDNDVVTVKITRWPEVSKKAEGKIIKIIGAKTDNFVERQAIIESKNVKELFPKEALKQADAIDNKLRTEDYLNRTDLRNEKIYTIDGEDAKDLDDAVIVNKISDDKYMLRVCIADVSHYVTEGSELDKEAIKRGTSIYMPGKVIPMLPKSLSNGICSLNAGEDRLALTVDMYINKAGEILDSQIYKSVINVTKRMTYTDVYTILTNNDKEVMNRYQDNVNDFYVMKELTEILLNNRHEEGAINFNIPESKIELDENDNVASIAPYKITIANKMIEEFMVTANMVIAEKMYWLEAPFIYRIHEQPDSEKIIKLNTVLSMFNKNIKNSKVVHPKYFQTILEEITDEVEEKVVSTIMLRSLKLAKYSYENLGHFGLAAKYYCHFTSPIRRYPDLFIHRVISKYIEDAYNVNEYKLKKLTSKAIEYAYSSSECEKKATEIEREVDDLYRAKYMKEHIGETYDGIIASVTSFGFFVTLENTVQGLVSVTSLTDDYYVCFEDKLMLIGEHTGKMYKLGDKVKVKAVYVSVENREVDFEITK